MALIAGSDLTPNQLIDALEWHTCKNSNSDLHELIFLEKRLLDSLSVIRTTQNTLSPINQLPPEILFEIFDSLRPSLGFNVYVDRHWENRSILCISQVCRHWRNIALACPLLWSSISQLPTRSVEIYLARSGEVPLDIDLIDQDYQNTGGKAFANQLASHSKHFKTLSLRPFEDCSDLLRLLQFPAPQLESLSLQPRPPSILEFDQINPVLPKLFDGCTPNLRKLDLWLYTSWDSGNKFQNLTHIRLNRQSHTGRPSLSDFLDFIESSPGLEELITLSSEPLPATHDSYSPFTHRLVTLNHLRTLSVGWWDSVEARRQFVSHLNFPPTAQVFVFDRYLVEIEDSVSSLYLAHSGRQGNLGNLKQLRFSSQILDAAGDRETDVMYINDSIMQFNGPLWEASHFVTLMGGTTEPLSVEEMWLGFHFPFDLSSEDWRSMFSFVPCLTKLVIWDPLAGDLVISAFTSFSVEPVICPELRTLHVYTDGSLAALTLITFAAQRQNIGKPLQHLCITTHPDFRISASDFSVLSDWIEVVEFREEITREPIFSEWPPPGHP